MDAVTDPDVLLMQQIRSRPDRSNLEQMYLLSKDEDDSLNEKVSASAKTSKRKKLKKKSEPVQFKGLSTTAAKRKHISMKSPKKSIQSRSSTMPGFSGDTDRQRAFRDGIRLVEQRTGEKYIDTPEASSKRRKVNGEAMYKHSASVPDSLVQFAEEIHQVDRISRAEEVELGEKTQQAIQLQNLYDNLARKLDREPTDEEWCAAAGKINMESIRQTIEEGLDAKNKLVTSNLRMVQSVVNTYIRNGLTAQYNAGDMMQEGIIALIRAAEKFEPDRGWKFSTYAMYWVRASVKRSQIYQSRIITVPQRLHENYKRLLRIEKELTAAMGRRPTREELGAQVGMSKLQVDRCFTAMEQQCFSLDQEMTNTRKPMSGDTTKETLIERIDSRSDDGEHDRIKRVLLREDLIETLHRHLTPEEVEILLLRYGIKEAGNKKLGSPPTIAELSRMVGLKPDKVRRMIDRSLKQLKSAGGEEWLAFERELK